MHLRRNVIALLFTLIGYFCSHAQVTLETSAYLNNHWTGWDHRGYLAGIYYRGDFSVSMLHNSHTGTFVGLKFWQDYESSNNWCFLFYIDNYVKPDKKSKKEHNKNNIWYEYSGYVEYYVSDEYPTIDKVLQRFQFPMINPYGETVRVKRTARATIKIAPYKNNSPLKITI